MIVCQYKTLSLFYTTVLSNHRISALLIRMIKPQAPQNYMIPDYHEDFFFQFWKLWIFSLIILLDDISIKEIFDSHWGEGVEILRWIISMWYAGHTTQYQLRPIYFNLFHFYHCIKVIWNLVHISLKKLSQMPFCLKNKTTWFGNLTTMYCFSSFCNDPWDHKNTSSINDEDKSWPHCHSGFSGWPYRDSLYYSILVSSIFQQCYIFLYFLSVY